MSSNLSTTRQTTYGTFGSKANACVRYTDLSCTVVDVAATKAAIEQALTDLDTFHTDYWTGHWPTATAGEPNGSPSYEA